MKVAPTNAAVVLKQIQALVAQSLGAAVERVLITPSEQMIREIPPGGTVFATVVPVRLSAEVLQDARVLPAELIVSISIFSRVSLDRGYSAESLLLDPARGLLTLGDKLLAALAGNTLDDAATDSSLLRQPLRIQSAGTLNWGEAGGIVLAYLTQTYSARMDYALPT